jgi:ABC-2 type transport system ATP-binding protein
MNQPALIISDLYKSFGAVQAVRGVSFQAARGEVLSLLGPNGAGKSTTISMISGLLRPDGGDVSVMGHSIRANPRAARASIGVVPQDIALYADLSARENLVFWGRMYGLGGAALSRRVDEILAVIGLTERQKDRIGTFSGGMKRRVNIGAALLHNPGVIIMDEPTVGIDPQSRRHILDNVKNLNQAGMTVLYTTHYMEEAAELSHHVAIIDQGKVVAYGTHAELIRMVGQLTRLEFSLNAESEPIRSAWEPIEGVSQISCTDGKVTVLTPDSNLVMPRLFNAAEKVGLRIQSVEINEPNLESVFLHLTGRALRD